jgi:hypothetical protein
MSRRPRSASPRHVLMLPDFERADRIGEFWGNPKNARREQDSVVRQRARMYLEDVRIAGQHATCLN